jgi:hypothetical protein
MENRCLHSETPDAFLGPGTKRETIAPRTPSGTLTVNPPNEHRSSKYKTRSLSSLHAKFNLQVLVRDRTRKVIDRDRLECYLVKRINRQGW